MQQPVVIGDVVWEPDAETIGRSRLRRFMDAHGVTDLAHLQERSTSDPEWFWDAVVKDLPLEFYEPYREVLDVSDGIQWARWFGGATMNIVHSCLDRHRGTAVAGKTAVIWEGEPGDVRRLTYGELDRLSGRLASALRALGVERGDRVGIFLPMIPETAVAVLACARLGAVFIPLFSGYGPDAVATRLADGDAKLLICADGFHRRGNVVPMKEVADQAAARVGSVRRVIVVRHAGREVPWQHGRDLLWDTLLEDHPEELETVRVEPETPFMIIYTSGTTGRPKGAVHVHAGFPLKAAQDLAHGFDMGAEDTLFWFTDIGWMMGPWLIFGSLLLGGTMVLYEGTPDTPAPDRLWRMIADHGVTIFGVSPTLVRSLMPAGDDLPHRHDLSSLRILGGTGEPWNPEPWRWFFEHVGGGRLPVINYSGGTEISGGIVCGNVLTPLRPTAFAGPLPGMAADVLDEAGHSVRGQVGELAIRAPWPGMTRGFWKDDDRYLATYWSRFPNVWLHGDWAYVDPRDGLWYILGRSDDTIKVAGKRLGPAEVESLLVGHDAVREAAAIGVPDELKGEVLVCFVVPAAGRAADDALVTELKDLVAGALGKPLRPSAVLFVPDLPRTRNAKILRRVVKAAYLGLEPGDLSSLENPGAVEAIGAVRS
jgi:acetyl-CoA synthetase